MQYYIIIKQFAAVVELADALDSKSSGSDTISVRPRSAAPFKRLKVQTLSLFFIKPITIIMFAKKALSQSSSL